MQSAKETAANVAASARAGMEKTKAVVEEKAEKMAARDPVQKQMATEKKEQRVHQAEMEKLAAKEQNAASRQAAVTGGPTAYTVIGGGGGGGVAPGHTTGTHGTTAGYTTGGTRGTGGGTHGTTAGRTTGVSPLAQQPIGMAAAPVATEYPTGTTTGTGRTPVQDPNVGKHHGSTID